MLTKFFLVFHNGSRLNYPTTWKNTDSDSQALLHLWKISLEKVYLHLCKILFQKAYLHLSHFPQLHHRIPKMRLELFIWTLCVPRLHQFISTITRNPLNALLVLLPGIAGPAATMDLNIICLQNDCHVIIFRLLNIH